VQVVVAACAGPRRGGLKCCLCHRSGGDESGGRASYAAVGAFLTNLTYAGAFESVAIAARSQLAVMHAWAPTTPAFPRQVWPVRLPERHRSADGSPQKSGQKSLRAGTGANTLASRCSPTAIARCLC
jgi:hypothetical protein